MCHLGESDIRYPAHFAHTHVVISSTNVPHRLKRKTNLAKLRAAVRIGASSGSKVEEQKTQELVQVLHEQLRECEKQADDPSDNTSEKKLKLPIIRRDSRLHPIHPPPTPAAALAPFAPPPMPAPRPRPLTVCVYAYIYL